MRSGRSGDLLIVIFLSAGGGGEKERERREVGGGELQRSAGIVDWPAAG